MLYKRNYFELTVDETNKIQKAQQFLEKAKKKGLGRITAKELYKYHNLLPNAYYHNSSLFPNNYILFDGDRHNGTITEKLDAFSALVKDDKTTERDILNYIKRTESYFILESLLPKFNTGHHDAYLFREFELPSNYVVDFLLVGKNSGGYEFIFIEFESPNIEITLKDGSLGTAFRNGIKQIEDWDLWIDSSFFALKNVFKNYKNPHIKLPEEFYELDKTRIHFMVIAGKRKDFNSKTYRLKRKGKNGIKILHYDNLIDETYFYINEWRKYIK